MIATRSGSSRGRVAVGLVLTALVLLPVAPPATAAPPPTPPPKPLATPILTTVASAAVAAGGSISDTAVLTGGSTAPPPTGKVTFQAYGPNDAKCAAAPAFTATVPLASPTMSGPFTPTKAGMYTFVATYSGDANNATAKSKCGDLGEAVSVTPLTPTLTTVASPSVLLGGTVSDTAVLMGGYKPSGTITFKLYGVSDPGCTGAPVFTSSVPVGSPTVSGRFRPTAAGTYRFIATYNGDAANTTASSACGDVTEAVVVMGPAPKPPPPPVACNSTTMARALLTSLLAALTATPGSAFKATCSAGVRIVLRAKEIRPGSPGFPRHDGFTTMANNLTHTSNAGTVTFSYNAQGLALRDYARSLGTSLVVFAIVHVRPDGTSRSSESIQIFNLR